MKLSERVSLILEGAGLDTRQISVLAGPQKQEERMANESDLAAKAAALETVLKALTSLTEKERARVLNAAMEFYDVPRDPKREWR